MRYSADGSDSSLSLTIADTVRADFFGPLTECGDFGIARRSLSIAPTNDVQPPTVKVERSASSGVATFIHAVTVAQ